MQLIIAALSVSLSLVSFTTAAGICTSSSALSWPPVGDCSIPLKFDTIVENCRACCLNDGACFQACAEAAGAGSDAAADLIKRQVSGGIEEKKDIKGRADALSCAVNEGCYEFTDGSLLCLNLGTGLYHDDVGGHGDYFSGEYTNPDGRVQTGTSTATTTKGSKASATGALATAQSTTTVTSRTASSTGSAASSALAPAPSQGSAIGLRAGANLGFIGLIAGLAICLGCPFDGR